MADDVVSAMTYAGLDYNIVAISCHELVGG